MRHCATLANASHILKYAALVESPRALPCSLILVFQQPVDAQLFISGIFAYDESMRPGARKGMDECNEAEPK